MTAPEGYPFAYVHECGQPAFYLRAKPERGDGPIKAIDVVSKDGSHPLPETPITCGHCGENISHLSSASVVEMAQ